MNAYVLDRPKKGVAIIINNLHDEQPGTQNDVISLEKMFQVINVIVEPVRTNQSKADLDKLAIDLGNKDLADTSLFFLVVISHGIFGDKIKCHSGKNEAFFDMEEFVKSLGKNETMIGFPKILIFDFCRGEEVDIGQFKQLQQPTHIKIPSGSDIFIGFATTKGRASATSNSCSPYIQKFCKCVEESHDKKHFINIFQDVQYAVSKNKTKVADITKGVILDSMQVPEMRSTLRQPLFLSDEGR